jgi:hypothetical protein
MVAIKNYDVVIKATIDSLPSREEDSKLYPPQQQKEFVRQVFDRENEKCLRIALEQAKVNVEKKDQRLQVPPWRFVYFSDGIGFQRGSTVTRGKDPLRTIDFDNFCVLYRVPFIEYASLYGYPIRITRSRSEIEQLARKGYGRAVSRELPDGTVIATYQDEENGMFRTFNYDAKILAPVAFSYAVLEEGKRIEKSHKEIQYLESNGLLLPTKITWHSTSEMAVATAGGKLVSMEKFVTASFEWLQVNMEALQFPNVDELGHDVVKWSRFIRATDAELLR